MVRRYITRVLAANRDFLLRRFSSIDGFMELLMKQRNTGDDWTDEEIGLLRFHLKALALSVPALMVICLPGGAVLLPLLVKVMERRKAARSAERCDGDPE